MNMAGSMVIMKNMTKIHDILAAIGSGTRYNLHSHTQFCDGHADMETMVQGAIAAGLTHYPPASIMACVCAKKRSTT